MADVPVNHQAAAVRRALVDLVRSQGPGLLEDGRRVRAMLADSVAGATAEANLIALAIASGVPPRLREAGGDPGRLPAAVDSAAEDLQRTSSVQGTDARWAVESIAEALGLVTVAVPARAPVSPPTAGPRPSGATGPGDLVVHALGRQHTAAPGVVVTLGRDPDCTITLESPAVSRLHGRVVHGPGGWEYRDDGSTQGSFVNGVAVRSLAVRGETEVTLGQGNLAVAVRLVPFGEAQTRAPQRPRPAQATELPGGRPGGALAGGNAPATELGRGAGDAAPELTVEFAGTTRTLRPGTPVTLGREDDNDLVARHTTVSRHHVRIEHDGGAWRLRDLGSTSGTWLGGRRLESPVELAGRQEFVLGDMKNGDRLITRAAAGTRSTQPTRVAATGRRPSGRVLVAGVLALVLVLAGGAVTAWRVLKDDPSAPAAGGAGTADTADTLQPDDIARATVHLVDEEEGWQGSGVIIDRDRGLILTNAHVAAGSTVGLGTFDGEFSDEQTPSPSKLRVDVSGGLDESAEPRFYAETVAVDGYLDVAVVQITTKSSGAPVDEEDLAGLSAVPLGDSDDLSTADNVSFYGYPAAADSVAPTFTKGVVAGSVQDDRLNEFRAVINTTADISGGNSGGPAVDDSGKVVGLATWEALDDLGGAFSRIRPINLARPVIEAAIKDEAYVSPWSEKGPRTAKITFLGYGSADRAGQVTAGCTDAAAGADPTTLILDYQGFPGGPHTDVAAALDEDIDGKYVRVATSTANYPTRLPRKGCMTLTFDEDLDPGTYRLKVGVGGDLRVFVDYPDFTIE